MLCFVLLLPHFAVGTAAIATFGYKGAKDAKLPITVGPQTGGETCRSWGRCSTGLEPGQLSCAN